MDSENSTAEVKPEVSFLFELIRDVVAGRVRIPIFQRPYVWRREQMLDLLDSIRLQFPIGSLLLWETEQALASRDAVGPIPIAKNKQSMAAYVLDGQQRLSTLVGVLQKPSLAMPDTEKLEDPARWQVWFNAEKKNFEHPKPSDVLQAWHCPLWSMMDTVPFLQECTRILSTGDAKAAEYVATMQTINQAFSTYKVPVIRLRNTTLSQAVEIFSRLNSKGQKMSADEMATALNYKEEGGTTVFNLAEKIDALINELSAYGFKDIARSTILRTYMAAMEVDVYSKDWNYLVDESKQKQGNKLQDVIVAAGEALKNAISFLQELGVKTTRLLPYAMQLVTLSAFYFKCKSPSLAQKALLRRWFWVSSFTCHFASGNPSRDNTLLVEFRDEISQNPAATSLRNMRLDTAAEPFPLNFDMRSARSRTLLLVMLSLRPHDNSNGEIAEPWRHIEDFGPDAMGRIFSYVKDAKELAASPANRILQINSEEPQWGHQWLKELASEADDEKRNAILASHAIEPASLELLQANQAAQFLRQRRDHLIQIERDFMQREQVALPLGLEAKPAPIDNE